MSVCSTELFLFLLCMISLKEITSNKKIKLNAETPQEVHVKRSYADLLDSLIRVNQERVSALKKLYVLNSVTYGKDVLRSSIRHKLEDYDKMQDRLIKTLKRFLDNLEKQSPKPSITENDLTEILHNNDHVFVLPLEDYVDNDEVRHKVDKTLRNKDSDSDDDNAKDNSVNDSKSTSSEKFDEEEFKATGNGTQDRSYYYYGCGRGRVRCIKACKQAYRDACDDYYCRSGLRSSLRSNCKSECKSWFY